MAPPTPESVEAAFFDLDKTVIAKAAMLAFGPRLQQAGLLNRWMVARALWGQIVFRYLGADEGRMEKMRETALKIAVGWEKDKISALVDNALSDVIDPLVYAEALELMQSHRDAGRRVYLVSASPEEIVMPLARHLGVDDAIATRARIDADGRYTGEVEFYSAGIHKVEAIERERDTYGLALDRSFAYSDSVTDLPMLEAVGHPVAVNPDRALLKEAEARGWEIRTFENPRPLREGSIAAPKPATVGAGALGLGLAAGLAFWWRLRSQAPKRRWPF
ncbi:MAG: HAD superfamily hydrolase (TIGR01490 family) [Candidatus Aldehydirespiratoraceae bacterium]|jgi:HAD superfamily hydrolase (TIGR01490 family)